MYAFDIKLKNNNPEYKELAEDMSTYIFLLERTGQVLKNREISVVDKNIISTPVLCPEIDSYKAENSTQYVLNAVNRLEQKSSSKIVYIQTGRAAEYPDYKVPENSSYYILRDQWVSPIVCGDTFKSVPLYKIPYTYHDGIGYDDIVFWQNNYERLYGLWTSVYESFALGELQNVHSELNKIGRELCAKIEKLTGVPTYLFLFNDRDWSKQQDLDRKCPLTGNDWRISDEFSSGAINFKCDESRLVSELSPSCDPDYFHKKLIILG